VAITLEDIQRRAARWERRICWRNLREYAAGVVGIAIFLTRFWRDHGWRLAPSVLLIGGVIFVMFQLHRRGATRSLPADAGLRASLDFHLRELERQRDALHTVWLWYLLPFVPGFVAVIVVSAVERGTTARLLMSGLVLVLFPIGVWRLNEWAARKIDGRIQELKAMELTDA
jgi:hypothetical protein